MVDKVGRKVWVKTFRGSTSLAQIEREARLLALEHDRAIAIARGRELTAEQIEKAEADAQTILARGKSDAHHVIAMFAEDPATSEIAALVNAMEHGGRYVPDDLKLSKVYERDRERYGEGRDEKPVHYAVDSLVAVVGDKDVRRITRDDVSDWIKAMRRDGLKSSTIRRRVGPMRAMANRAFLDFGHGGINPFVGHKLGGGGSADDRLPFNRAMLAMIDKYLAMNRRIGSETRDVLRVMKCTGAGPAEVAGLALADVSLDAKVPHAWIRATEVRGLKTKASEDNERPVRDRRVPLVAEALDAMRDVVKRARATSRGQEPETVRLFVGFGIGGRGADSISAKLNKAIRAAGVPKSPRLTAYSYRHTMKEALRSASVADHVQRRVLGHSGEGVADRYGSPSARLAGTRDALVAAMEHLGDVDSAIYGPAERVKD
ncbi:MAG: hypothetical protein WD673_14225 [Alphaproteobacteria bacterium]